MDGVAFIDADITIQDEEQSLRSILQDAVLVVGSAARMLFPVCDRAFMLATLR